MITPQTRAEFRKMIQEKECVKCVNWVSNQCGKNIDPTEEGINCFVDKQKVISRCHLCVWETEDGCINPDECKDFNRFERISCDNCLHLNKDKKVCKQCVHSENGNPTKWEDCENGEPISEKLLEEPINQEKEDKKLEDRIMIEKFIKSIKEYIDKHSSKTFVCSVFQIKEICLRLGTDYVIVVCDHHFLDSQELFVKVTKM